MNAASNSRIFLSAPWTDEAERTWITRAFDSGYVAPCGPMVNEFEQRLASLSGLNAAAVSSGTAALDLLMEEFKVGPQTTIFTSTLTFIATIGPAIHRGATPVFIDCDETTGTISPTLLERALAEVKDPANVLVIAADIYGQTCDYDAISFVCVKYGVRLVIDAAESVGATYKGRPAGTAGLASIYSFNGNKLITTSGGGAVLSSDAELVNRARWRAQQSRENFVYYEHKEVGYNYRLSNLLGAVGCAQTEKIPEIVSRKKSFFAAYESALKGKAVAYPCGDFTNSTRWLSVFLWANSAERDEAAKRLAAANAECRPVWKPMHLQPVFSSAKYVTDKETAGDLFSRGLCLPSSAGMTPNDFERVLSALA